MLSYCYLPQVLGIQKKTSRKRPLSFSSDEGRDVELPCPQCGMQKRDIFFYSLLLTYFGERNVKMKSKTVIEVFFLLKHQSNFCELIRVLCIVLMQCIFIVTYISPEKLVNLKYEVFKHKSDSKRPHNFYDSIMCYFLLHKFSLKSFLCKFLVD